MAIAGQDVTYPSAQGPMHGRLFRDEAWASPRPGVLVFPEGFGVSEHTWAMATRVAELGYVALACDLYGEGYFFNGPSPVTLGKMNNMLARPKGLLSVGQAALDYLRTLACVDQARIAASGYCIGATIAMELAFSGAAVAAVAGFHPSFKGMSLEDVGQTKGRMHLYIGSDDYSFPPAARAELEQAFSGSGVRWRMLLYGGIKHSFANPNCQGMGDAVAYDAETDRHSHEDMAALFAGAFAEGI